jgi:hypothetical protein
VELVRKRELGPELRPVLGMALQLAVEQRQEVGPSCGARRMLGTSARLVERVLPAARTGSGCSPSPVVFTIFPPDESGIAEARHACFALRRGCTALRLDPSARDDRGDNEHLAACITLPAARLASCDGVPAEASRMPNQSIALVCMPWHMLGSPSIQLGTLESVLRRAGIACTSHSLFLQFQDFLLSTPLPGSIRFTLDDYGEICSRWMNLGAGDWVFAVPAVREGADDKDAQYVDLLRSGGMPADQIEKLRALREVVPTFLERCADEILATRPAVVGFTNVYSQAWASAGLARTLRTRDPDIAIVFGGASCEGSMGPALLAAFPEIDVVVRGAAEGVLVGLVQPLIAGSPPPALPGLCFRDGERIVEIPVEHSAQLAMDDIPIPSYEEYFARLGGSALAATVLPQVPFETSRGCWWGMKAH